MAALKSVLPNLSRDDFIISPKTARDLVVYGLAVGVISSLALGALRYCGYPISAQAAFGFTACSGGLAVGAGYLLPISPASGGSGEPPKAVEQWEAFAQQIVDNATAKLETENENGLKARYHLILADHFKRSGDATKENDHRAAAGTLAPAWDEDLKNEIAAVEAWNEKEDKQGALDLSTVSDFAPLDEAILAEHCEAILRQEATIEMKDVKAICQTIAEDPSSGQDLRELLVAIREKVSSPIADFYLYYAATAMVIKGNFDTNV